MTTAPEPQNLGTVAVDAKGTEWVAIGRGLWQAGSRIKVWIQIDSPTVVHEGWVRPIAEPTGWGARIKSADGVRTVRAVPSDEFSWIDEDGTWHRWVDFVQPVTVLDPGESE